LAESLVIIASILLAFAIDAWWDRSQESFQRAELTSALRTDFETTRGRIAESREFGEDLLARGHVILGLTRESAVLPVDSLQFLLFGFFYKIDFEPALSGYEAAVGSGALAALQVPAFVQATAEFRRARDFYELHDGITAQLFYLGPTLELRQQLGSLDVLLREPARPCSLSTRSGTDCYPPEFALDARAIQAFVLERSTFGALQNIQTANRNIMRGLQEMDAAAERVLRALAEMR
jgi:hypothetical protein